MSASNSYLHTQSRVLSLWQKPLHTQDRNLCWWRKESLTENGTKQNRCHIQRRGSLESYDVYVTGLYSTVITCSNHLLLQFTLWCSHQCIPWRSSRYNYSAHKRNVSTPLEYINNIYRSPMCKLPNHYQKPTILSVLF